MIQKAFLSNIKVTKNWLDYSKSNANLSKTLAKSLLVFFSDNLARLGQSLSSEELVGISARIEENSQPD